MIPYQLYTDNEELAISEQHLGTYPTLQAAEERICAIMNEYNEEAEGAVDGDRWEFSHHSWNGSGDLEVHTQILVNGVNHVEIFTIAHSEVVQ